MENKIYVIAGNRAEYEQFIKRKAQQLWDDGNKSISLSDFVFVHSSERLRGMRNVHGYFIGTFAQRSDIEDLKQQLCIINNLPYGSLP